MHSGSWNKEFVLPCHALSLWFWQTLPSHLFWKKKKSKNILLLVWRKNRIKRNLKDEDMCDFSLEKNVLEFVPTTPRMILNSFNSSLLFVSETQKNHLEMIRPDHLSSVKSRRILWQLLLLKL